MRVCIIANLMSRPSVQMIPFARALQTAIKFFLVLCVNWPDHSPYSSLIKCIIVNVLIFGYLIFLISYQPCLGINAIRQNSIRVAVFSHALLINACSLVNLIISLQNDDDDVYTNVPYIVYGIFALPVIFGSFYMNLRSNQSNIKIAKLLDAVANETLEKLMLDEYKIYLSLKSTRSGLSSKIAACSISLRKGKIIKLFILL